MNIIEVLEQEQLRSDIPDFRAGDTVKVYVKVVEGTRERVQMYEGVVIARSGAGVREMFTVRRISYGVGVERTFPIHSPRLEKIEVSRRGIVRRAKLYYLRSRGLSEAQARRLMVDARFAPAIDKIPLDSLQDEVRENVARRLNDALDG